VISCNSKGIGRCKPEDVGLVGVGEDVERLGDGGIEQRFVADTVGAAVFGQLRTVHGQDGLF
jgi:hypothetical protein